MNVFIISIDPEELIELVGGYTSQCVVIQFSVWLYKSVSGYTSHCMVIQVTVWLYKSVHGYTSQCYMCCYSLLIETESAFFM